MIIGDNFSKHAQEWMATKAATVTAITPTVARQARAQLIPEFVINIINELIIQKFQDKPFTIKQIEICNKIEESGLTDKDPIREGWLDFEDVYREAGWKVTYNKPSWGEDWGAYFDFEVQSVPYSNR